MMNATTVEPDATADELRAEMVATLRRHRVISSPSVEAAMRAVPRHPFVPETSLADAYAPYEAVVIARDVDGRVLSSASAPQIVAAQLEQLQPQPGDRVLEIGAGTGYNAALLAHLVGPDGFVVAVEYHREIAERALRALAVAGCDNVMVVCADGALGVADHAPYDRLVATAGVWDVVGAWREQLAEGGRLVVPLRLRWPMSVALDKVGGMLRSVSTETCGFIPMEGADARPFHRVEIADGAVVLHLEDMHAVDPDALAGAFEHPRQEAWTGIEVSDGPTYDHLFLWLIGTMPEFAKFNATADATADGLVRPLLGWGGPAFHDGGAFAYLTNRGMAGSQDGPRFELAVYAHGPHADRSAERIAAHIRTWDRERRSMTKPRLEVHSADTPDARLTGAYIMDRPQSRLALFWEELTV